MTEAGKKLGSWVHGLMPDKTLHEPDKAKLYDGITAVESEARAPLRAALEDVISTYPVHTWVEPDAREALVRAIKVLTDV